MINKIKFGTDGWRAIIAKEYTVENVKRVAEGTALWMLQRNMKQVVIGHDCRFGGKLFMETTAAVMAHKGIKAIIAPGFVSTPMVSLGVVKTNSDVGVIITASHNPPSYNGFKLKSNLGGPMIPKEVSEVEALIPDTGIPGLDSIEPYLESGMIEYADLEDIYIKHITAHFDIDAIKKSGIGIAYDAMYGAGQNAMMRLFPDATFMHCDENPSFKGQAPEPIHRNLIPFSELIKNDDSIHVGIANDGDADRIGMYDEDGSFVDSHRILLLLLVYAHKYKQMKGKVVVSFSVTDKLEKLAKQFGVEYQVTKIGFKYIAEIMTKEEVMIGGEESGGLAIAGHIPERDGIWIGMVILEFMAKTGKTLKELIQEVYSYVGAFAYDRDDVHVPEDRKQAIIQEFKTTPPSNFGKYQIERIDTIDGFRFYFTDGGWVMIRPSGTEPLLRVYAQAETAEGVREVLDTVRGSLGI